MKALLQQLQINEKFTKTNRVAKTYNTVKDNIPLIKSFNYMSDLLFLPTAAFGYKYLLTMVDLADDTFDVEPIKNKDAETTLKAMKTIFKRGILIMPKASIRLDQGSEFKSVFHKYLYDHDVMVKYGLTNRHTQVANVESLNKQLGRLINGYLNAQEERTGKIAKNWIKIIPIIRDELNKIRKKKLPENIRTHEYPAFSSIVKKEGFKDTISKPKYKVGQMVHRMLDFPKNALGTKQSGKFRMGDYRYDTTARAIVKVLYYTGDVKYRYMIDGIPNASFNQSELMKA